MAWMAWMVFLCPGSVPGVSRECPGRSVRSPPALKMIIQAFSGHFLCFELVCFPSKQILTLSRLNIIIQANLDSPTFPGCTELEMDTCEWLQQIQHMKHQCSTDWRIWCRQATRTINRRHCFWTSHNEEQTSEADSQILMLLPGSILKSSAHQLQACNNKNAKSLIVLQLVCNFQHVLQNKLSCQTKLRWVKKLRCQVKSCSNQNCCSLKMSSSFPSSQRSRCLSHHQPGTPWSMNHWPILGQTSLATHHHFSLQVCHGQCQSAPLYPSEWEHP